MLILLPPSESKANRRRGRPVRPQEWSFPALAPAREEVARALAAVSTLPDATSRLGVSPGLAAEVARNLTLDTAPATPAAEVYTGVLYDALDLATMSPAARRRANRWLVVVSALYGAVRPKDAITAYRLSMDTRLEGVGAVAAHWRPALKPVLTEAAGRGLIVDCRSSTYAAAWTPRGDLAARWVQIRIPGASHMAKHTRGLVARTLCEEGKDPRRVSSLLPVLSQHFSTTLHPPTKPGSPWIFDVLPPSP